MGVDTASTTLKTKDIGTIATIKGIETNNPTLRQRLLSLGLIEGRKVAVTKKSPFGNTLCIELIGFSLALRLTEAEAISVLV